MRSTARWPVGATLGRARQLDARRDAGASLTDRSARRFQRASASSASETSGMAPSEIPPELLLATLREPFLVLCSPSSEGVRRSARIGARDALRRQFITLRCLSKSSLFRAGHRHEPGPRCTTAACSSGGGPPGGRWRRRRPAACSPRLRTGLSWRRPKRWPQRWLRRRASACKSGIAAARAVPTARPSSSCCRAWGVRRRWLAWAIASTLS